VLTCGSVRSAATAAKGVKLHWKKGTRSAKRKGRVDFALFNIPRIAKSLMPVDNERKHGGVAEPIRRLMAMDVNPKRKGRVGQLKALRFLIGRNAGRLLCLPRVLNFHLFSDAVLEDVFEGGLRAWIGH
jgi:hypothetical protein